MNFKTFQRGCQLASLLALAGMLGGCVTYYGTGSKDFEATSNQNVYALVRYVHPGPNSNYVTEYCASPSAGKNPECHRMNATDHISVAIGRDSWGVRLQGFLVPKAAHVRVGDIVVFRAPSDQRPYSEFVRVAARAADTQRLHCGWVGSKIAFSGGVVCDGWRYDKDYPLLAH